jgi:hypothetical protein
VLHFAHQTALQTDEIAWHGIVQNQPAAIRQQFVAKSPTRQHCIQMGTVASLDQNRVALVDGQVALLEATDEDEFLLLERPERRQWPQWAVLT